MKLIKHIVAGSVIFVSACASPAFFSSSLSEPDETAIDDSVVGIWYLHPPDKNSTLLTISRIGEDRLGVVFTVVDASEKSVDNFRKGNVSVHMIAHPSELNGQRYYNVTIIGAVDLKEFADTEELDEVAGYMIHKVTVIDDDWLVVHTITENSLKKLPGWSEEDSRTIPETTKFIASREEIKELVTSTDSETLFAPYLFYRRLQPVTKESVPPEIRNQTNWLLIRWL